ncbi:MAG: nitrilase-related carbon-nitrogen hydrolase [Rhodocyclaceae bacterium]
MIPTALSIAMAQTNATVGDLAGNVAGLAALATQARERGARLMLAPELALCGYPPDDLLLRHDFMAACRQALRQLAEAAAGVDILVGHPHEAFGERFNAASILRGGRVVATYCKQRLPGHQLFDELRYFSPGQHPCVVDMGPVRVGLTICADVWDWGPVEDAREAGAELLLVLNASPFHLGKRAARQEALRERVLHTGMAAAYVNLVGGQDALLFDGASFALNADGSVAYQAPSFVPRLDILEYAHGRWRTAPMAVAPTEGDELHGALCLGVRDALDKNGVRTALVPLRADADTTLIACLALSALGADRVRGLALTPDAVAVATHLGMPCDVIDTAPAPPAPTLDAANWQSAWRRAWLEALARTQGALVLVPGNKTERALGVGAELDVPHALAPLKDVTASQVRQLMQAGLDHCGRVPAFSWANPAAGLASLPAAPSEAICEAILAACLDDEGDPNRLRAQGFAERDIGWVVQRLAQAERERQRAPLGIRVSRRGFGREWRYPAGHAFGGPR